MRAKLIVFLALMLMLNVNAFNSTGLDIIFVEDYNPAEHEVDGRLEFMRAYNESGIIGYEILILNHSDHVVFNTTFKNLSEIGSSFHDVMNFTATSLNGNFTAELKAFNSTSHTYDGSEFNHSLYNDTNESEMFNDSNHIKISFVDFLNVSNNNQSNNQTNQTQGNQTNSSVCPQGVDDCYPEDWWYEDAASCYSQQSESVCSTHTTNESGNQSACEWDNKDNMCEPAEIECYQLNEAMCSQAEYCSYDSAAGCYETAWLYADAASCLPIDNESVCSTHTTTYSSSDLACMWEQNDCEPRYKSCNQFDQNTCNLADHCSWDGSSCHDNQTNSNQTGNYTNNQTNQSNSNTITSCMDYGYDQNACNANSSCVWQQDMNQCFAPEDLVCENKQTDSACYQLGSLCQWDYVLEECFEYDQNAAYCYAEFFDPYTDTDVNLSKDLNLVIEIPVPDTSSCENFNAEYDLPKLDLWSEYQEPSCDFSSESDLGDHFGFCEPEPKFSCNAYSQAQLSDDNSTYVFNISNLASDKYNVQIRPAYSCEKALSTLNMVIDLNESTSLNKTFGTPTLVTGTAKFENGDPVAYANINAYGVDGTFGFAWAQADENGTFTLFGLSAGEYKVEIATQSWDNFYETDFTLNDSNLDLGDVVFGAGPGVNGYVLANGVPQNFTWVSLRTKVEGVDHNNPNYWNQIEYYGASTDANGRYTIAGVEPGTYLIEVWPDWNSNFLPFEGEVTVYEDNKTEYNITLSQGNSITGRVVDGAGQPLEGVEVNAFVEIDWEKVNYEECEVCGPGYYGFAQTDSNGEYHVKGIKPAEYVIEVRPNEWFNSDLAGYTTAREKIKVDGAEEINFTLEKGIAITGFINDGSSAITCGWINAWIPSKDRFSGDQEWTWSNINYDGSYTLNGIKSGKKYQMYIEPCFETGLSGKNSEFNVTNNTQINFNLSQGGKIIGKVVDSNDNPVQGASVSTWLGHGKGWGFAMTGADGNFKIKGLTASSNSEKYEMEIFSVEHSYKVIQDISVADGTETDVGTIKLGSGKTLNGTVAYSNGTVIPNAYVDVWCEESFGYGSAQTNDNGFYEIDGLPDCSYNMYVNVPATYEHKFTKGVNITSDLTYNVTFNIVQLVSVSGKVSNSTSGLSGAYVSIYSPSNYAGGFAETSADGTYTIENLPAGNDYEMIVEKEDYYANFSNGISIASGTTLNYTLNAIDTNNVFNITGTISGVSEPVMIVAVNTADSLITKYSSSNSTYTISELPTGNYKVFAVKGTEKNEYPAAVTSSASSGIDFDFS